MLVINKYESLGKDNIASNPQFLKEQKQARLLLLCVSKPEYSWVWLGTLITKQQTNN